MGRPTIYSIAEALHVHASTVSRALNHPEMVRPEVRSAILAKAAEIGYIQNTVARSLITGQSGVLGLLVPDIENPFFPPLVRAIDDAARDARLKVLLMDSRRDPQAEIEMVEQVLAHVDGLILAAPRARPSDLIAAARRLPVVFVNRAHDGARSVTVDNTAALEAVADSLVEEGHCRLVLLRGPKRSWAAKQRCEVIQRWATRRDVDLVEVGPIEAVYEGGFATAPVIAASRATAVIAFDDVMACGVISGLLDLGLSIPKDVSVVGCDDVLLARTMYPALTTIQAPFNQLGTSAVAMLLEEMSGDPRNAEQLPGELTLAGVLTARASTGPAPQVS